MAHTPEQLQALRDGLLRLHKTLLDSDRVYYERAYGPVGSSGEWLQLVLGHEHFAWLRPFSGLIVRIDEWLANDERLPEELRMPPEKADLLFRQVLRASEVALVKSWVLWTGVTLLTRCDSNFVSAKKDLAKWLPKTNVPTPGERNEKVSDAERAEKKAKRAAKK